MMGGRGSGTTRKHRHRLPRKYSEGALARVDRRYREPKAMRAAITQMVEDAGGRESVSFLKLRMIQRTAYLDAMLISAEAQLARGRDTDVSQYLAGAATFLRYTQALGLERVAKDAGLTLRERLLKDQEEREAAGLAPGTEIVQQ